MSRSGSFAALDKDQAIACVLRLVAKHHSNAESINTTLTEHLMHAEGHEAQDGEYCLFVCFVPFVCYYVLNINRLESNHMQVNKAPPRPCGNTKPR